MRWKFSIFLFLFGFFSFGNQFPCTVLAYYASPDWDSKFENETLLAQYGRVLTLTSNDRVQAKIYRLEDTETWQQDAVVHSLKGSELLIFPLTYDANKRFRDHLSITQTQDAILKWIRRGCMGGAFVATFLGVHSLRNNEYFEGAAFITLAIGFQIMRLGYSYLRADTKKKLLKNFRKEAEDLRGSELKIEEASLDFTLRLWGATKPKKGESFKLIFVTNNPRKLQSELIALGFR